ncbi:hypothetical protein ACERII_05350 [Evansella sp. AB-rgal1]|uniref:hypothetical protein n=1 Tax=Evansella sp. AB-rgal1 TaxID=3242696 RepID=UPI00359CBACF
MKYHVSMQGNDQAKGTSGQPFCTISLRHNQLSILSLRYRVLEVPRTVGLSPWPVKDPIVQSD